MSNQTSHFMLLFPCVFFCCFLFTEAPAQSRVPLYEQQGVYYTPVKINGLNVDMVLDTGAGLVVFSIAELIYMVKHGHMDTSDIGETSSFVMADGSRAEGNLCTIRELIIGNVTLRDVKAIYSHEISGPLLLGQSALQRLGDWRIDHKNMELVIAESSMDPFDRMTGVHKHAIKLIRDFVEGEDNRDIDRIMYYFSPNIRRYYNLTRPGFRQIKLNYLNTWKLVGSSTNRIISIKHAGGRRFEMDTVFSFFLNATGKWKRVRSTVVFILDENLKITELYAINNAN